MAVYEFFETVMEHLVEVAILIFEFIGVIVIIMSGLKGFYYYLRRRPDMKLTLAQGLAVGLEFKLCSEILKTVTVRDFKEIATVAGIIALRAALTFLIHWEIKEENHNQQRDRIRQTKENKEDTGRKQKWDVQPYWWGKRLLMTAPP